MSYIRKVDGLVVRGKPEAMADFKARLEAASDGDWVRRENLQNAPRNRPGMHRMIAFESRATAGHREVIAWLREERPEEFPLGGAHAAQGEPLSERESNEARRSFGSFLEPFATAAGAEVVFIPFRIEIERYFSREAMGRLNAFVAAANRTLLREDDLARWRRFVARMYFEGSGMYRDELAEWFDMEGWPESIRKVLFEFCEDGFALLRDYDEERVAS